MTDYIRITELDRDGDGWEHVEQLFSRMYGYFMEHGALLPLADGGAGLWVESFRKTAGRFGILLLALLGDEPIGFASGSLRFLPSHLGGRQVGYITFVYVREENQGSGTGRRLVRKLEEWFGQKGVHSIELQVLCGNEAAIGFWKRMGYLDELLQMRKLR
jgi:ribosomal protein S18 acetylase RimI-like enzyme